MSPESRTRRADAVANRERLLDAAAAAIATRGEGVPMAEVAELAGVGIGTLYRNFPAREDLFGALIQRALAAVLARVEVAAQMPGDAIEAIGWFLRETIAHRGELALPLHGVPPVIDEESAALQKRIRTIVDQILARGREDGSVRAAVTSGDVITTGAMLAQPLPNAGDWDRRAERQAEIFLAGLGAPEPARSADLSPPG